MNARHLNARTLLVLVSILIFRSLHPQQTLHVPSQFPSVQSAIAASVNGDTVLVAPGTYVENINFMGKNIIVRSVAGAPQTVLDGNASGSVVSIVSGEGPGAVLDGFMVTGGTGTLQFLGAMGGGINIENSSPVIQNCIVQWNVAVQSVFSSFSNVGGGIRCFASLGVTTTPTIRNCWIKNNTTNNGGGIGIDRANTIIERCVIENNFQCNGFAGGGGIALLGGSQLVRNCIIRDNVAGCPGVGGGIFITRSTASIISSIIANNTASLGGGLIIEQPVPSGSMVTLFNCTIVANTATNTDGDGGGGIIVGYSTLSTNTIIRDNVPSDILASSTLLTATHSDVANGWPGTGNIDVDPRFVDAPGGDYRLDVGSPCIDAGDTMAAGLTGFDFEGDPRVFDGVVDIGADEFVAGLLACGAGTVGGPSGPFDVLLVNGAAGGTPRRVDAAIASPLTLSVLAAPTSGPITGFILWAHAGVPGATEVFATGLGPLCFLPAVVNPLDPRLLTIANSLYPDPLAVLPSTPAPWSVSFIGPPFPIRVALQGILVVGPGAIVITNGLVLNVHP